MPAAPGSASRPPCCPAAAGRPAPAGPVPCARTPAGRRGGAGSGDRRRGTGRDPRRAAAVGEPAGVEVAAPVEAVAGEPGGRWRRGRDGGGRLAGGAGDVGGCRWQAAAITPDTAMLTRSSLGAMAGLYYHERDAALASRVAAYVDRSLAAAGGVRRGQPAARGGGCGAVRRRPGRRRRGCDRGPPPVDVRQDTRPEHHRCARRRSAPGVAPAVDAPVSGCLKLAAQMIPGADPGAGNARPPRAAAAVGVRRPGQAEARARSSGRLSRFIWRIEPDAALLARVQGCDRLTRERRPGPGGPDAARPARRPGHPGVRQLVAGTGPAGHRAARPRQLPAVHGRAAPFDGRGGAAVRRPRACSTTPVRCPGC